MHQQSLKLLCSTVEKMHLQENTLSDFDLDLHFKVTQNIGQYPLHHVTYAPAKFGVAVSKRLGGYIYEKIHYLTFELDLHVKVTRKDGQYPLHHVTYAPAKFEFAVSNRLEEDTFTRKYII